MSAIAYLEYICKTKWKKPVSNLSSYMVSENLNTKDFSNFAVLTILRNIFALFCCYIHSYFSKELKNFNY